MIKQGEVAYLKTTGEAVYVLSFQGVAMKQGDVRLGDVETLVEVRRPVMGQDGVRHIVDKFYTGELETLEEQRDRFAAERKELLTQYGPKPSETSNFLA